MPRRCLPLLLLLLPLASSVHARDPNRLTHGPMLGRPTATSMHVWGRTADPGEFVVKYGLAGRGLTQTSAPARTALERDNTGFAQLQDLDPGARYEYQIHVNGVPHGLPGSFLTLPSAEQTRHPEHNPRGLFNFRFEVGSCANQNPLHGIGHRSPTYENLNRDWADKAPGDN